MNKLLVIVLLAALASPAFAASFAERVEYYLALNGLEYSAERVLVQNWHSARAPEILRWDYDLPFPTEEVLPTAEEAAVWKAERIESAEAARQAAKPPMRKYYENMFFDLIDELLVLTNNPQEPTPKLGFPELQGLINQIQSTDPTAAVNLSLNLLTIDAALKRYDMMWWDDAVRHDLGE